MNARPPVSQTELDVLKTLWEHGPGTVRDVDAVLRGQGRRWAYTTVLTLLHRLQAKGYVASDKTGQAHVFRAAVSREDLVRRRLRDLADELCEGTATPLVLALVKHHDFSPDELDAFRRLLEELDEKPQRAAGRQEQKTKRRSNDHRGG